MSGPPAVLLSAEHGGNRIPAAYRATFRPPRDVLDSHRGHDPGTTSLARTLARALERAGVEVLGPIENDVTRLLVDANRASTNPRRFSEWSRGLPADLRERAVREVWAAHRDAVEGAVRAAVERGARVLHLSVHSFTPVWEGEERAVDVGVLYDPRRAFERRAALDLVAALRARRPDLRVRRNAPYRGVADGLTRHLRRRFADARYAGLELEVSQRFPLAGGAAWSRFQRELCDAVVGALDPGR